MRFMILLKAARVGFSGKTRTVIEGPFAETKELIAGYWMFQVQSKEESIEIRQVFEVEDFANAPEEVKELELAQRRKSIQSVT